MEAYHNFTIHLSNVNEDTKNLEDSLYEAGCMDALLHFKDGTVALDFTRNDKSFNSAVISAINDIESASINAEIDYRRLWLDYFTKR
jgi:hypothetical protein